MAVMIALVLYLKARNTAIKAQKPERGEKIATLVQSARCPVVSQPKLAALTPKSLTGLLKRKLRSD